LVAIFWSWSHWEATLSVHDIDSTRRELFYWATVAATFALGTAVGDLTAITFSLGYLRSAALFAVLLCVPAVGYRWFRWNAVFAFWFAYVVTRPFGASIADWLGKPRAEGGIGFGSGPASLCFLAAIIVCVASLAITKVDVQERRAPGAPRGDC
jgi:uncharacterized membrane-anchored protein